MIGTITFVTREGGEPFSPEEIALASDLADRCAMALDNARLFREADALRASANEANRAKSQFPREHEPRAADATQRHRRIRRAPGNGNARSADIASNAPTSDASRHNQEHLVALIAQILNFVRTESGRMEYQFTDVPVQAALTRRRRNAGLEPPRNAESRSRSSRVIRTSRSGRTPIASVRFS